MSENAKIKYALDGYTIALYVLLVLMGWISIFGASYDFDQTSILDWNHRAGKQFVWILTAFGLAGIMILVDYKVYNFFAYFIAGIAFNCINFSIFHFFDNSYMSIIFI